MYAPKAEAPEQVNRPLSKKHWGCVSVHYLHKALWVVAVQELTLIVIHLGDKSPLGCQGQVYKGHHLGGSHKKQSTRYE